MWTDLSPTCFVNESSSQLELILSDKRCRVVKGTWPVSLIAARQCFVSLEVSGGK